MTTNNAINISTAATGKILQGAGIGTAPIFSTATYPSIATGTGKVLVADGTNWVASTPTFPNASATSGKFIISDGTNWIASTPTLPNAATSTGTIIRADGTNWVATTATYPTTTTANQLLYSSATSVVGGLTSANNGTLVTSAAGVPSILAGPGTTGAILQSNAAAAPSFSTATYPSTATGTGTILRADGTNWVATTATYPATTTVSQILYSSATNVVSGLTTGNDGVLITSHTGVPSILANGTTGQLLTATTNSPPTWTTVASGTGDVVGPGSATDNALVRFDTTTGKLIQNGVITEDDTGNLSQSAAVSGASLSTQTLNTSNTASATAYHQCQVAGASASDAYYIANINAGQGYSWGLDNSDSDAWVLSATVTPGTTNVMRVNSTGEINYPLQSSYMAYLTTTITDVTGDDTTYTVIFDTEVYDQNSDFNLGTSTFTAPVTGRYFFEFSIVIVGATTLSLTTSRINTSNRIYNKPMNLAVASTNCNSAMSVIADMDSADTTIFTVQAHDIGGKIDDVAGTTSGDLRTFSSGYLAC